MNKLENHSSLTFSWVRPFKSCLFYTFFWALLFTHTNSFANSTTTCTVNWTTTNSSITITGLSAPHIIFKLFTPDWKTQMECFDNCTDPLTITGLTAGATYHVSYNLYDANWNPTCSDLQDVVIEENNGTSPPFPNQPDLSISNLTADASGVPNAVANYRFNLNNFGATTATGDYIIKAYISSDNQLSGGDAKVGEVPTGNTPIGTISNVPGSITVPNLIAGNYFLILKADQFNSIAESNENNNTISTPFRVLSSDGNPGGSGCGFLKLAIHTSTFSTEQNNGVCNTVESANSYTFRCTNTWLTIDKEGNFVRAIAPPAAPAVAAPELGFELNETSQNFTVNYGGSFGRPGFNKTVTLNPGAGLNIIDIVRSNNKIVYDGYLIVGTLVAQDANTTNRFFQYAIKIDINGSITSAKVLGEDVFGGDFFFSLGDLHTTQNGYAFNIFQSNLLSIIKFDLTGNFLWKTSYASDLPSNDFVESDVTTDEQFIYLANTNNVAPFIDKINLNTGEKVYKARLTNLFNTIGSGLMYGIEPTTDGGIVTSFSSNRGYTYGKLDANGNIVWQRNFDTSYKFVPVLETSDGGFLFLQVERNVFSVMKTSSDGDITPTCGEEEIEVGIPIACDLNYRFAGGNLSISGGGLNAGHVILKVFDASWKTIFSCLDDCGTSINLNGLTTGSYHVSIDLYDSNWQSTCRDLVRVELRNSFTNTSEIATSRSRTDFTQKLDQTTFKVYPNPAKDILYVDLETVSLSEATIQLRDYMGRLLIVKPIGKDAKNTIPVSLDRLTSGIYWLTVVNQAGIVATKKIVIE